MHIRASPWAEFLGITLQEQQVYQRGSAGQYPREYDFKQISVHLQIPSKQNIKRITIVMGKATK